MRVSTELLQDSAFDLEAYIAAEFARAFGIAEELAFCTGNGTNQPTGIFTANGGEVGVTATSATAITVDELISTIHSHPTVTETIREAALNAMGRAIHTKN